MIAFSCAHCGMKFSVKDEFAGRQTSCPTCRRPLVVPQIDQTVGYVAPERLDGQLSSLARAGIDPGVTLGTGHSSMEAHENGQPSLRQLLAGGRNGQRYLLAGEIARGGMGAVLRAVDCDIRREVAVKYLLDQADERKKARFVEEAQITGQLEHPNIVPIHELGVDAQKRLFFSMKMVKGRSLQQVLAELRDSPRGAEKEYPLGRLLTMFVNICHALAYAHSRGVVHRDLKPANVMIGDFGEVYVMDWGLAKVLADRRDAAPPPALPVAVIQATPSFAWAEEAATKAAPPSGSGKIATSRVSEDDRTVDGTILGTPLYMPPEQAMGNLAAIDERSDVYSLGAILYEMLTLQPPIDKQGGHPAILARVREGTIVPPQQRDPARTKAGKVPRELSAIALKALAKDKKDRYTSVEALRRDIERFLEGRSVSAKDDTKWEATVKFVKRNKGFSVGMAAALLVLLCSLFFIGKAWLKAERAYAAYQKEQEDKKAQARKSVPAFVRAARLAINERQFDDALAQAQVAVDYAPDNADAHLLKAELLIVGQDFESARAELERCVALRPDDAEAKPLLRACRKAQRDDMASLVAFADLFTRQKRYALADGMLLSLGKNAIEAKEKLLAMYRQRIESAWAGLGERLRLDGEGKFQLRLDGCKQVDNLEPLKGMPLTSLDLSGCGQVRDLSPLKGMQLTSLNLSVCPQVRDLSPLKGMPLTSLDLSGCGQVRDLSPLKGMQLTSLNLWGCGQVRDLSPLVGMPLTSLYLYGCSQVRDLSPLKGMQLTSLNLWGCGQVRDLSPLVGMPLTSLYLYGCSQVRDLSPLVGMPLTSLDLSGCGQVRDLSPLKGMQLTSLNLWGCGQVRDLSPLVGMPLTSLYLYGCSQVRDLSPLAGMDLPELWLPHAVDRGMDVLRRMKALGKINDMPAAEFWKKYDAGEFKQYKP